MAARRARTEAAKVHLHVLGQDHELSFSVGIGPRPVTSLLKPARELANRISQIAVEHAEAEGKRVSCKAGCGACCRQIVPISGVEAIAVAQVVAAMPKERQAEIRRRFADAVDRLEEAGLLDPKAPQGRESLLGAATPGESAWDSVSKRYFQLQIACPFLEDESCGIYQERPLVCREYHVTTPAEWCAELSTEVESVPRPARMGEVLTEAANALVGTRHLMIPLTLALEWARAHTAPFQRIKDGEKMFWTLLEHMELEAPPVRSAES